MTTTMGAYGPDFVLEIPGVTRALDQAVAETKVWAWVYRVPRPHAHVEVLMRLPTILGALSLLALPAAIAAQDIPARVRSAASVIHQAGLRRDAEYLASDVLRGRLSPSPGLDSAAAYVVRRLAALTLSPAGDAGTHRQHYDVRTVTVDSSATWMEIGGRRFPFGDSVLVQMFSDSLRVTAPAVYVGHGVRAPKKGIEPWEGLDVRGKIVIAHGPGAFPAGETFATLGTVGADWFLPWQTARSRGAAALLLIPRANMLRRWNALRSEPSVFQHTDLFPPVPSAYQAPGFPSLMLRPELLRHLLAGMPLDADSVIAGAARSAYPASFAIEPARPVTINIAVGRRTTTVLHNVIAKLEGSDPALRDEAVVLMAHLDGAVGPPPPGSADSVYNAADDNASGSAGLLAIAEAMVRGPRPRRSVVFIWDTGEEVGLWGSRFYATHPVVPLAKVVAHYNVDMIGRSKAPGTSNPEDEELAGPNEIHVVGPRVLSTELDSLVHRTNRTLDGLVLSHRFDLPAHEFFYPRTDGGPLLERGVPVIGFQDGTHADYHGVGDEAHKLDVDKMRKVSRLVYVTAWLLADSPARPRMDKGIPAGVPRHLQP